jgi:hypothetical protein
LPRGDLWGHDENCGLWFCWDLWRHQGPMSLHAWLEKLAFLLIFESTLGFGLGFRSCVGLWPRSEEKFSLGPHDSFSLFKNSILSLIKILFAEIKIFLVQIQQKIGF